MGLASIIENINITFNCFKSSDNNNFKENLIKNAKKFNIIILPIEKNVELKDLFPVNNHVETWNIFIIGISRNYILANINSLNIKNYSLR